MYAKTLNNEIVKFPYTFFDLTIENPNTSFDDRFSISEWYSQTENCATTGAKVKEVTLLAEPLYNSETQILQIKSLPQFENENLVIGWDILEISLKDEPTVNPNE